MIGAEAVVGRREDAAHQEVADLRRREVDDAGEQAGIDQLLHRLAAGAGGVEDQALELVAQRRRDLLHGGRCDAEHGEADGRQAGSRVAGRLSRCVEPRLHHADERVGAVGEHLARDPVQALNVGDRIHHGDVGRAD